MAVEVAVRTERDRFAIAAVAERHTNGRRGGQIDGVECFGDSAVAGHREAHAVDRECEGRKLSLSRPVTVATPVAGSSARVA